jgi:DNA-binding transcriptional LysR family regulator
MTQTTLLSDLYRFICVVEAGSFSAAADKIGTAKSSLSRRVMHLEQILGVQLLNRTSRQFTLTTIGEQIYRHALNMMAAAEAATHSAQEALGSPSGIIRLAAPGILLDWLLGQQSTFRQIYPQVTYALVQADAQLELRTQRLDLSLSLGSAPLDSSEIVVRPLAQLRNVIVGTAALLEQLGNPKSITRLGDDALLASGCPTPQAWQMDGWQRDLQNPALCADNLITVREAAKSGIGLACLPIHACRDELASGALALACPEDTPAPTTLYALTASHRSITQSTRCFLLALRSSLGSAAPYAIELLNTSSGWVIPEPDDHFMARSHQAYNLHQASNDLKASQPLIAPDAKKRQGIRS